MSLFRVDFAFIFSTRRYRVVPCRSIYCAFIPKLPPQSFQFQNSKLTLAKYVDMMSSTEINKKQRKEKLTLVPGMHSKLSRKQDRCEEDCKYFRCDCIKRETAMLKKLCLMLPLKRDGREVHHGRPFDQGKSLSLPCYLLEFQLILFDNKE